MEKPNKIVNLNEDSKGHEHDDASYQKMLRAQEAAKKASNSKPTEK